jgi:ubiquinone/menaquinone biosynthesis C-methylase UbiE/uncharacterized protein YbaR (Trm112 family)
MQYLACPIDRESPLNLEPLRVSSDGDILEGAIRCPACATVFPIRESIPSFVSGPGTEADDEEVSRWKAEEQLLRDVQAAQYDGRIADSVVKAELMGLARLSRIERNHALLDLGCGTGRVTLALADKAQTTVGMDFSFASLKVFEKRIPPDWKGRVHLVQGDAFHLPLRNKIFHQVVSNGVFEHLPGLLENKGPVLEAARVLVDHGVFVFSIYNYSALRAFMARLLPTLTYGAGYHREGFHAGKIYFRRYRWQEIQDLLEAAFEVEHIGGMRIIPKEVLKRGGQIALSLERVLQSSAVSSSLGYYLLVSGRKRG